MENIIFQKRLNQLIEKSGKSTNQIEREMGYTRNALHNYRKGREPSGRRLIELAQYFKASPEYLLGMVEDKDTINMIVIFEQMSDKEKFSMIKIMQEWVNNIIIQKIAAQNKV